MKKLEQLYQPLRALKWPDVGKWVGEFALYETLLVGFADRATHGDIVEISELPLRHAETVTRVDVLRRKVERTHEEQEFLDYFGLLGEIHFELSRSQQQK